MRKGLFLTAAVFALAAGQANAGVVITSKHTELDTQMSDTVMVYLDADRMKVVAPDATVIFRGDQNKVWILQPEQKSYMEMTPETMRNMGTRMAGAQAQMNAAMAQMQAQLAQMPPAQREQMERMMAGRMGGAMAAAPKTEYRKTGASKVGSWACDTYEGYRNNQKVVELCTVAPTALGFAASDFEVAEKMADFFSKLVPQGADNLFRPGKAETQGFSGVPVRRVTLVPTQSTSEITQVTRQTFPLALALIGENMTATVDEKGKLTEATVQETSNVARLDEAALKYAKALRYVAGTEDNKPVTSCFAFRVKFQLKD